MEQRGRVRPGETDPADPRGTADPGAPLYETGAQGPHAAGHGAGERGVSADDRTVTGRMAESGSFLRSVGPVDAPRAGGFRPLARLSKARRRSSPGLARRSPDDRTRADIGP